MEFDVGSRTHLTRYDLGRFSGTTLFDRIGQVVCEVGCLPRKELYESWAVARRVQRRVRGGRVVDLAAGHGLTASILLLLDPTREQALAVDGRLPRSAARLRDAMAEAWPSLRGAVELREVDLERVPLHASDCVVSIHACGALTDLVLARALSAGARVAVLPCCHDVETCDTGQLEGWLDVATAIDATRALRLRNAGYRVHTQTISCAITPKNRLLVGMPADPAVG